MEPFAGVKTDTKGLFERTKNKAWIKIQALSKYFLLFFNSIPHFFAAASY